MQLVSREREGEQTICLIFYLLHFFGLPLHCAPEPELQHCAAEVQSPPLATHVGVFVGGEVGTFVGRDVDGVFVEAFEIGGLVVGAADGDEVGWLVVGAADGDEVGWLVVGAMQRRKCYEGGMIETVFQNIRL